MRDERLPAGLEQRSQLGLALIRFGQQAAVGDLSNVAGIQFNRDGETVTQFVQFRRIVGCPLDDLGQGLLAGGHDPHLALAQFLQVAGQAIQVQDQLAPRGHVLSGLVNQKQDVHVLRASVPTHQVNHPFCQIAHVVGHGEAELAKAIWLGEILRQEGWQEPGGPRHADQGVIVDLFPFCAVRLAIGRSKIVVQPAIIEGELELGQFFLLGIARELQHLPVQDVGDGGGGALCQLLRAQVEQHHGGRQSLGHRA